jgi:mRNA interferase YafQ
LLNTPAAFDAITGEKSGRHGKRLLENCGHAGEGRALAAPLFRSSARWRVNDHRDYHLRPDLILIYRKPDDASLELVRLGSHSELGL